MLTVSKLPFSQEYVMKNNMYYLSTGRFLSLLVGSGDFSWEIWGMRSETGEWRKVLPDVKLGAQKYRLKQLASAEEGQVWEPLGWVKYPEVLALPYPCAGYYAIVHKNSLTWLS